MYDMIMYSMSCMHVLVCMQVSYVCMGCTVQWCVCIDMYVCMYAGMYVHVCMYVCMYVYMYVCMYVCMHVHVCMYC